MKKNRTFEEVQLKNKILKKKIIIYGIIIMKNIKIFYINRIKLIIIVKIIHILL